MAALSAVRLESILPVLRSITTNPTNAAAPVAPPPVRAANPPPPANPAVAPPTTEPKPPKMPRRTRNWDALGMPSANAASASFRKVSTLSGLTPEPDTISLKAENLAPLGLPMPNALRISFTLKKATSFWMVMFF